MSGAIVTYSPKSKTYVPKGPDGKFAPRGPVKVTQEGIVKNPAGQQAKEPIVKR